MTTMTDSEALAVLDDLYDWLPHLEHPDNKELEIHRRARRARAHIAEALRDAEIVRSVSRGDVQLAGWQLRTQSATTGEWGRWYECTEEEAVKYAGSACGYMEAREVYALSAPKQFADSEALRDREWRPIESAPKDGSQFLVWVHAEQHGENDEDEQRVADISFCDIGWWRTPYGYVDYGANQTHDVEHPTHWMPLPEPPK